MAFDPRHASRTLLDGADRAAARSYFKAIGFTDEDLARPLIGVAHCWIEITPCKWNHQKHGVISIQDRKSTRLNSSH